MAPLKKRHWSKDLKKAREAAAQGPEGRGRREGRGWSLRWEGVCPVRLRLAKAGEGSAESGRGRQCRRKAELTAAHVGLLSHREDFELLSE